ncbi:MAG: nickel transporter [Burkholderiales bacterium]|nr:nickel transporter [Burkholderiales bacterium]
MADLPTDLPTLCAVVLLLGLKHGFDADHLATIDGMTRLQARAGRPQARWCGALFSLGHGTVVVAIALLMSLLSRQGRVPEWLDATGVWISVSVLLVLGVANLRAVLASPPGVPVAPVGLKSALLGRLLGRWTRATHPAAVAGVGALFALSFDTLSQAALFALAASSFGGAGTALLLGLLFTAGMLITDAVNGWWIARLIARADVVAAVASRVMGLAVAALSLLVAALAMARQASGALDTWADAQGLTLGLVMVGVPGLSYALARWLAARGRAAAGDVAHPV